MLCTVALAATRTATDENDQLGLLDIASVRISKTSDGMIRTLISTHESWEPAALVTASGPPAAVCVFIWTKRAPGIDPANYEVCASPTADGRKLRAVTARIATNGSKRKVSGGEVDRPDFASLALEVDPRRLKLPASVRIAVQTQTFGADCPAVVGCEDFAPARGKALLFKR